MKTTMPESISTTQQFARIVENENPRPHAMVTGAGGFIGGHLVRRLLNDGYEVAAVDIKSQDDWWQWHPDAVNFPLTDAGNTAAIRKIIDASDEVYHLAENMGGIGFIETHLVECASSVVTSVNLLNACHRGQKVFFSSSACVYPKRAQMDTEAIKLSEWMAYPADPEPGYGWEKLYVEQLMEYHRIENGLDIRVVRFHNSYGPLGSWGDGREKAPAAIMRKVALAKLDDFDYIDVWGDGNQTRSFMYIDDNVEGIIRLMNTDWHEPVNLGTEQLVSVNDLITAIELAAYGESGVLQRRYQLDMPKGVRGRNSDNTLLRSLTSWEPSTMLREGIEKTYPYIEDQIRRTLSE
jgi:GDP-D-mannose 3', 5'-epimerase